MQVLTLAASDWIVAAILAALFVHGHFWAPKLVGLRGAASVAVTSAAAGISIAFIFGNLLPRLAQGGSLLERIRGSELVPPLIVESGLFFTALAGLLTIYSFESRTSSGGASPKPAYEFRLGIFAFMSAIYGFSLPAFVVSGWDYATLLTVVMVAHTISRDRLLVQDHPEKYRSTDRWFGLVAVGVGLLAFAVLPPLNPLMILLPMAFLSGSLLMTTFRVEMPSPDRVRLPWLLGSALLTTGLLIAAAFAAL